MSAQIVRFPGVSEPGMVGHDRPRTGSTVRIWFLDAGGVEQQMVVNSSEELVPVEHGSVRAAWEEWAALRGCVLLSVQAQHALAVHVPLERRAVPRGRFLRVVGGQCSAASQSGIGSAAPGQCSAGS